MLSDPSGVSLSLSIPLYLFLSHSLLFPNLFTCLSEFVWKGHRPSLSLFLSPSFIFSNVHLSARFVLEGRQRAVGLLETSLFLSLFQYQFSFSTFTCLPCLFWKETESCGPFGGLSVSVFFSLSFLIPFSSVYLSFKSGLEGRQRAMGLFIGSLGALCLCQTSLLSIVVQSALIAGR